MKKGFTLIELLGTILILSAIVLIVAPLIINKVQDSKVKLEGTSEENIVLSAKNWAMDNKDKLPINGEGSIYVPILETEGYLTEGDYQGCVIITNENGVYYYRYDKDSEKCRENALVDNTPPKILEFKVTKRTTMSLTVAVTAEDKESKIVSYEFSIDGGKTWNKTSSGGDTATMTFNELKDNTSYTINVKVTNALGKTSAKEIEGTTIELITPTLSQNGKYGVIDYKGQCGKNNVNCSYIKDSGNETSVVENTSVLFNDNGILVAKKTDGVNNTSASLSLNNIIINASYSAGYYYCSSGYSLSGTTCKKTTTIEADYSSGYYYCSSGYTLSGTTCKKTTTTSASYSSPYYSCPSGYTRSGTTCKKTDTVSVTGKNVCGSDGQASSWTDNQAYYKAQGYSCTFNGCADTCSGKNEGYTYNCYATCSKTFTASATYHSGYYYCSSGYTLSGTTCKKTTSKSANYSPGYYYCSNSDYTLSGTKCKKTTTKTASYSPGYYYCKDTSKYSLSGDKCVMK